jgi:hypothetical protein
MQLLLLLLLAGHWPMKALYIAFVAKYEKMAVQARRG